MLGCTRQELLGQPLADYIAPEDREDVLQGIQAGIEVCKEKTMVRKDGSRFIAEAHGKTAQFGNRRVRFTAIRDVTERKHDEEVLRKAKEQLANYNLRLERTIEERTASLQETVAELHHFSYALAHDLRAPLRATNGFLTLIERQSKDSLSLESREWLRRVKAATEHLDLLITDALNYTKAILQDLPLEPVNLQTVLASLIETYPNLQTDKADIQIGSNLPTVLGSRVGLIQCLSNILDNAVKFSRPGTKPRILVWAEDRPATTNPPPQRSEPRNPLPSVPFELKRGASQKDLLAQFVRIWIEDNGIGISKEDQPRLFIMFQRLSADHEGTGIGLALVRKVVQRMGGEVGVESEEGRGSRFWFEVRRA
jgi:signal transduction histidine kinase